MASKISDAVGQSSICLLDLSVFLEAVLFLKMNTLHEGRYWELVGIEN